MAGSVTVVYAGERPPESWDASVFLAGPTPRSADVASWRPAALDLVHGLWSGAGALVVFVPEPRDGSRWGDYEDQRLWELRWLRVADQVVFWVPRDLATLPGLTTNDEWGWLKDSGRAVFGSPEDAAKVRYQREYAADHGVPLADTLADTLRVALERVGAGEWRTGGERDVPLVVWTTPVFRYWYAAQRAVGNTLVGARVVWTFRADGGATVVWWAVHVAVAVAAEGGRVKDNEVVIGRPDTSAVLLYRRASPLRDTVVVLVREFRSPACSDDGFVHELPGGSADFGRQDGPDATASAEVREETGLALAAERLRGHGVRQVAATVSAHRTHVYSAELTEDEVAALRADAAEARAHGVGGTERTHVEVTTYGGLLAAPTADWATIGMVARVLADLDDHAG
ncbi:NUDIX hydrolase [Yinghuangia sp. ASG 101]|uniref:nucleoside 2-deoxyribosyltransferase domain-containing protein n=1 Tax=Yinghuangia sp. ASG 101 TaxID=2896848 RepID=UPI001E2F0C51|nr:nucleoside 2-deoxyribosyltransferase domain-containing protein [Yinghuangia sp. ASG 101]UGQ09717.1 NUDIX hydrolase [Yinghuangia sp. ASG 101]